MLHLYGHGVPCPPKGDSNSPFATKRLGGEFNSYTKRKTPQLRGLSKMTENDGDELEIADDVREDVADCRADERQNDDNHDGYQDENERVFDQTLTFFTGHVQHFNLLLKYRFGHFYYSTQRF
jgi:hypothetical protein